jgi:hypothetical protein
VTDHGARELAERLAIALAAADDAGSVPDDWRSSEYVDRMAASLLADGAMFLPDGLSAYETALRERGWRDEYKVATDAAMNFEDGLRESGRELERLRVTLAQYGVHGFDCGVWYQSGAPSEPIDLRCTCGLSAALTEGGAE